jgi:hypothetical protein
MSSTFKGLGLFNSGAHRFRLAPEGEYVLRNAVLNPNQAGSTPVGPLELVIFVTGRLVAPSESALWALRDAITAQLTHPVQTGTLIDHHGRTWTNMSFVEFATEDRTDRGRVWSIAYTAKFIRF